MVLSFVDLVKLGYGAADRFKYVILIAAVYRTMLDIRNHDVNPKNALGMWIDHLLGFKTIGSKNPYLKTSMM